MPRSTREWALRKLQAGADSLDWTKLHLAEVGERYEQDHPEISGGILEIISIIEEVQKLIQRQRMAF